MEGGDYERGSQGLNYGLEALGLNMTPLLLEDPSRAEFATLQIPRLPLDGSPLACLAQHAD